MKNQILFLFLFISTGIQAQKMIHELPAKTNVDSTNWLFLTGNPTSGKLYKITAANLRDSIAPATDTTSLSNRIDLKLNATDTASLSSRIDGKQATLVSATNIKTVNGSSLLGSGNLVIAGGGSADGDSSWYIVTDYGADKTGVADATAEIQATIDAAEVTGGIVYIPRGIYKVTDTLLIRADNVVIMGEGESSKILASGDYGNIFDVRPTTTPTDQYTGINGIQFRNFYIESETAMTSGAAIHVQYSYNFIAQDMRIGTLDFAGDNSVPMNIYDGIHMEHQSAAIISGCQIYPTHYGVRFSGNRIGGGAVGNFYWDGLITGNCNIWGKRNNGAWVTGSAGVYIGGGCGGVQIEQSNISFFDNGIRADGENRELFIGHAFSADDCGGAGIYITGELNILQMTGGWAAGNGRGSQEPSYGLYIDSTVRQVDGIGMPKINITGGTFYSNDGGGFYIGAGDVMLSNVHLYQNGSIDLRIGPDVSSLTVNGGRIINITDDTDGSTKVIRGVTGQDDFGGVGVGSGVPGGSNLNVQFNNSGSFNGTNDFTFDGTYVWIHGYSANSTLRIGTLEFQNYALSNSWIGDNVYFDGSGFKARATGPSALFYFQGDEGQFRLGASVTAGSAFTQIVPLKISQSGVASIGGNTSTTGGVFTGGTALFNNDGMSIGKNGSAPVASALIEMTSTAKGFLPPRMTASQAGAISSPAEGLLVYVTDTDGTFTAKGWWGWDGSAWAKLNN